MMNKYQKALNCVISTVEMDNGCAGIFFKYNGEMFESIDVLKELVENNEQLQNEVDKYKHEYYAECDRVESLDKSLGKACKELENYASSYENPWSGRPFTKDQWKEWCMKADD